MKKINLKYVLIGIMSVSVIAVGIFGFKFFSSMTAYKNSENTYNDIKTSVVSEREGATSQEELLAVDDSAIDPEQTDLMKKIIPPISVDFEALRAQNDDVIGWIYCPGTVINYPIVQGDDNSYYLNHLVSREYNACGTIFLDIEHSASFDEPNAVLYGHAMLNGSMFASISNYRDQTYFDEHPIMYLLTPEKNYMVKLFSGYDTVAMSDSYYNEFESDDAQDLAVRRYINASDFETNVSLGTEDHIITLSTCASGSDYARYVVQGKLIEIASPTVSANES